ncbi:MAG: MerR family transcriptional regulator [Chthoniobacterales bacterium]|nr:MerR family transcriptional regulator [Chthoniobacterales bacterium]
MSNPLLTIGELASRFGLRASTLRFYEGAGLIDAPRRNTGRRVYDQAAATRLGFIQNAQESGLRLSEIKNLIEAGSAGVSPRRLWRNVAAQKLAAIDREIAALRRGRASLAKTLSCRCQKFSQCEAEIAAQGRASPLRRPRRRR